MEYIKTEDFIDNPNKDYTQPIDGILKEYGCMKNVFPRTLHQAYGCYTYLDDPDSKPPITKEMIIFYMAVVLLALYVVMHINVSSAYIR